jgi:hypothetical protein
LRIRRAIIICIVESRGVSGSLPFRQIQPFCSIRSLYAPLTSGVLPFGQVYTRRVGTKRYSTHLRIHRVGVGRNLFLVAPFPLSLATIQVQIGLLSDDNIKKGRNKVFSVFPSNFPSDGLMPRNFRHLQIDSLSTSPYALLNPAFRLHTFPP